MGARHEVVISGVGPITAVGHGAEALWGSLIEGRTGTRALTFSWLEGRRRFKTRIGAPVDDSLLASSGSSNERARLLDPATRMALAAATMALEDAGFEIDLTAPAEEPCRVRGLDPDRAGVVLGTGIGGLSTIETSHRKWVLGEPMTGSARFSLPMLIPNAIPAQIAIHFDLRGECKAVTTACAAGTMAIGDAFRLIRDGELDVALTGASTRRSRMWTATACSASIC
ncbi:MAG: hypothetical protein HC882_09030 [Acidobacteria bacterium]|nr:hypothetical protein [Acidobacteriota bacterium]